MNLEKTLSNPADWSGISLKLPGSRQFVGACNFMVGKLPGNEKIEQIINCVKQNGCPEIDFYGVPIEKLKPWFFIRLRDGRSKPMDQRKVSKTYRFRPETVRILNRMKNQSGKTETQLLEDLVAKAQ